MNLVSFVSFTKAGKDLGVKIKKLQTFFMVGRLGLAFSGRERSWVHIATSKMAKLPTNSHLKSRQMRIGLES